MWDVGVSTRRMGGSSIFLHYKTFYVSGQLFGLKLYEINVLKKGLLAHCPDCAVMIKKKAFWFFFFLFCFFEDPLWKINISIILLLYFWSGSDKYSPLSTPLTIKAGGPFATLNPGCISRQVVNFWPTLLELLFCTASTNSHEAVFTRSRLSERNKDPFIVRF